MGTGDADHSLASHESEGRELATARAVAERLEVGHDIPPQAVGFACRAMLDHLGRAGGAARDDSLANGFRTLLELGLSLEERGRMLGSLLAIGEKATGVLRAVVDPGRADIFGGHLSGAERKELAASVARPVIERLQPVARWLEEARSGKEAEDNQSPPGDPQVPFTPAILIGAALLPRSDREGDEDNNDADNTADAGPEPEAILRNAAAPAEARVDAALTLGIRALPVLRQMAAVAGQREVAIPALVLLGREPALAREVRETAARMEFDPKTAEVGSLVRNALDGIPPALSSSPSEGAMEAGGWLQRSLENCSAPGILMASAGRESLVLPLVTQRLLAVRSSRLAG